MLERKPHSIRPHFFSSSTSPSLTKYIPAFLSIVSNSLAQTEGNCLPHVRPEHPPMARDAVYTTIATLAQHDPGHVSPWKSSFCRTCSDHGYAKAPGLAVCGEASGQQRPLKHEAGSYPRAAYIARVWLDNNASAHFTTRLSE